MYIPPSGPRTAKIAIVGEKPGQVELAKGEPFVGPCGLELSELLVKNGINRNQVYITNAVKNVIKLGNPTRQEIEAEQFSLYKELASLPNLNCIVPMGNAALQSLSNFQLGMSAEKSGREIGTGIKKYRGSILPSFMGKKMVPTYHPSYYMHGEWRYKRVVKFDLGRALEESYDPNIQVPHRRCYIGETREDLSAIRDLFVGAPYISFDIELLRGRYIECIAFAKSPQDAYCIPLTNGRRKSLWSIQDELYAWTVIQEILNQPESCYVTQNGLFDCWHLWRHGITTPFMHRGFDTMLAHRVRAPDLPHDLGFLVSIYTREPYYKDESGHWDAQDRSVTDQQFWAYNCKDAACTLEVAHNLMDDLSKKGMLKNFQDEVQSQWTVVTKMRQRGMHVDVAALQEARKIIAAEIAAEEHKITSSVGWLPNTQSSLQMSKLYSQLGLKLVAADFTKTGQIKRDVERIYSHAQRNPQHRDLLYSIASLNQKKTLQNNFTSFALDRNSFYHPSLDITKTKTGRMASEGADEGGPQIQNVPKRIRMVFIPDNPEQDELTNADLAGAETWLQAHYARDPLLIEALNRRIKVHKVRGCLIYRDWQKDFLPPKELLDSILLVCPNCASLGEKECNHSEYYMAKQSGHALGYREGPRRFCTEQRKKGIFISEVTAKEIQAKVVTKYFKQWHLDVEANLRRTPWVETPLGRRRECYGQLDDKLINHILSWLCQTTVGQITNRAMVWLDAEFTRLNLPARVITQTHDSVTVSNNRGIRAQVDELFQAAFHHPITIYGREFLIPIEITHGPNWRDLK